MSSTPTADLQATLEGRCPQRPYFPCRAAHNVSGPVLPYAARYVKSHAPAAVQAKMGAQP